MELAFFLLQVIQIQKTKQSLNGPNAVFITPDIAIFSLASSDVYVRNDESKKCNGHCNKSSQKAVLERRKAKDH